MGGICNIVDARTRILRHVRSVYTLTSLWSLCTGALITSRACGLRDDVTIDVVSGINWLCSLIDAFYVTCALRTDVTSRSWLRVADARIFELWTIISVSHIWFTCMWLNQRCELCVCSILCSVCSLWCIITIMYACSISHSIGARLPLIVPVLWVVRLN